MHLFIGEVLPEAWPPRIIPRDDQQVFRCFIGFFLLRSTDKNSVAALEIDDLWQLSMICYCFSMDDIPPLKTPVTSHFGGSLADYFGGQACGALFVHHVTRSRLITCNSLGVAVGGYLDALAQPCSY